MVKWGNKSQTSSSPWPESILVGNQVGKFYLNRSRIYAINMLPGLFRLSCTCRRDEFFYQTSHFKKILHNLECPLHGGQKMVMKEGGSKNTKKEARPEYGKPKCAE